MVEIERLNNSYEFPRGGVDISVRHFLQLPLLPEFTRDSEEDVHQVIKMTADEEVIHHSICGSFTNIQPSGQYFNIAEDKHFCTYAGIITIPLF